MNRREISAAFLTLVGAAGFAAMTQVGTAVFPHRENLIFYIGVALVAVCFIGLVGVWLTPSRQAAEPIGIQESGMTGDTYNNSGNNFGHMGPINIGKQQFQLTDAHIRELVQQLPKGKPVSITAIGGQRAMQIARSVQSAIEQAGFRLANFNMIGVLSPPPEAPLSVEDRGNDAHIMVAPDA